MAMVTTWPPPWPGTESQQPLSSPNPLKPEPVKSDSSQAMKITELPVQALEFMMALTVFIRKESPAAISACTWEKSQGSSGVEARPCMSWHWSGPLSDQRPAAEKPPVDSPLLTEDRQRGSITPQEQFCNRPSS